MHWHICATTRSLVAAKRKEAHSWAMAVPEAICQSGVRWKFGILTVYLQCSAVLDPRVWHHGILHLAAEFASMHFATGVKEQRGQGPVILCHLQFHTTLTFIFTFSWPWFKSKNSLSYYFWGEGFLKIGLYLLMGVNLEPIVDPPGHRRSGKGAKGQTSETLVVAGKEGNIGNSSSQLHR